MDDRRHFEAMAGIASHLLAFPDCSGHCPDILKILVWLTEGGA